MKIVKPSFEILTPITGNELIDIERAARTCYRSEDRITETSAPILVKSLITRGHEAMLEFSHLQVRFICPRSTSHELVRHRLCSFAQTSTRYVDQESNGGMEVIKPVELDATVDFKLYDLWVATMEKCEYSYKKLRELGVQPQIARAVLPLCLKTEIVVQANYREWRNILKLRTDKAAHPDIRLLMIPLLKELKEKIPIIFDDIEV